MSLNTSASSAIVQQAVGLNDLAAERHAEPARRSFSEGGFAEPAKLEQAIKANLRGLGYD
jgi:hypothetical protein